VIRKVHGVIRRRLLVNFRVDPAAIQALLPAGFAPKLQGGHAIAGICLIRLEQIRPRGFPGIVGVSSENAAHRIAVTWDGGAREGVYIPRRDTGSLVNHLAGGRVFPGEHQRARFDVSESGDRIALRMRSADGTVRVELAGRVAAALPPTSVFATLDEASRFFEGGSVGYSATASGNRLDGVTLRTEEWKVEPLELDRVSSSYFDAMPATFDCALIMRNIAHAWEAAEEMYV
jgi:uncharacterized protein YqjF (DUF2071 family)